MSWHRNGALYQMNLGNGRWFQQRLNNRLQPYDIYYTSGFRHYYTYDANGRMTSPLCTADPAVPDGRF